MFNVKIPSFENYKTEIRPAVLTSLKYVFDYLSLNKNQQILFNGEAEVSKLIGGEYDNKRGDDIKTDLGYANKVFAELEIEEAGFNDGLDAYSPGVTAPPFWQEPITGSTITPRFTTRLCNITVYKYFKDRVSANSFLNRLRSVILGAQEGCLFSVNTHYPIGMDVLECYNEIYTRLKAHGKVDETINFIDWMGSQSLVPWGIVRNLIGNNPNFVFKQNATEIGINYDTPMGATVNKGRYIGMYEVSFKYSFYWAEQTEWLLQYPIQVYQSPIPTKFMPNPFSEFSKEHHGRRFLESGGTDKIYQYYKGPLYHTFPSQDNWRPPFVKWHNHQLQVLVNLEDVESQTVLNIKEINGFTWDETFLKYILKYHHRVLIPHKSPLQIKIYSGNTEVLQSQLTLSEEGDLVLTRSPTMENIYRFVFTLDFSLRLYDEDCVSDMLNDLEYGRWILSILFPQWGIDINWGENGYTDWLDLHNGIIVYDGDEIGREPIGMMGSFIIAKNESNQK